MFPLGHVGIALGVAFLLMRYLKSSWDPKLFIIVVGVASVTPDLIDKPTSPLYGYEFGGRLFAHTLVFAFIVMVVCLAIWLIWSKRRASVWMWPLLFSLGVWIHLTLDFSPDDVAILLWPAYGWGFPSGEFSWGHLTDSPVAIVGEVLGAVILVYMFALIMLGRFAPESRDEGPDNA